MRKLRILHIVENYFPSVGGMQEVVKQLSERMVLEGHEIHVACTSHPNRNFKVHNGVYIHSFDITGSLATGISGNPEPYIKFVLGSTFDVIVFFAAQIWSTDLLLSDLQKVKAKTIFVPTGFSGLPIPIYKGYYESMKQYMPQFDHHVFLSYDYRDIHFATELGIKNYTIIPNAADEREFLDVDRNILREKLGWTSKEFVVLHIGSFTGLKGHIQALRIINKVKIPHLRMVFIGNGYENFPRYGRQKIRWAFERIKARLTNKKIEIHQWNREQTIEAFQCADLFLFPSNIECSPIVIFESMAAGLPFVASNVGNIAEIISWSNAGIVIKTTFDEYGYGHIDLNEAAKVLQALYCNPDERMNLSIAGKKAFKQEFNWKKITESYINLYHQLVS